MLYRLRATTRDAHTHSELDVSTPRPEDLVRCLAMLSDMRPVITYLSYNGPGLVHTVKEEVDAHEALYELLLDLPEVEYDRMAVRKRARTVRKGNHHG